MSEGESLQADSASRNERPAERSVMPTAGDRWEKLGDFIDDKRIDAREEALLHAFNRDFEAAHDAAVRCFAFEQMQEYMESLSDSHNETKQEGTSPTS